MTEEHKRVIAGLMTDYTKVCEVAKSVIDAIGCSELTIGDSTLLAAANINLDLVKDLIAKVLESNDIVISENNFWGKLAVMQSSEIPEAEIAPNSDDEESNNDKEAKDGVDGKD